METREVPSTLNIDAGGVLTLTGAVGFGNSLTISVIGSNYSFHDSGEAIFLSGPGSAGWTGSGTNTVIGPTASVNSINSIDLSNGTNTITLLSLANAVASVTGLGGNNRLVGPNAATTWNIIGMNDGNLTVSDFGVTFTGIQNLIGGSGDDTFVFASADVAQLRCRQH